MRGLVSFVFVGLLVLGVCTCGVVKDRSMQGLDCDRVKEGEFTDIANSGVIFLTRTLTEQHESSASNGQTPLRVRWLNDCSYQLARQDRSAGADWEPDTLTIRITGVSDTGFTYIASAVVFDTLRSFPGYQLFGLVQR